VRTPSRSHEANLTVSVEKFFLPLGEAGRLKTGYNVYGLSFTPDGKLLAAACSDNLNRLWDVKTQREIAELSGHGDYAHAPAFSSDGTRLVSASGDKTIRVWDSFSPVLRAKRKDN
jgi:WD40 repeat protein